MISPGQKEKEAAVSSWGNVVEEGLLGDRIVMFTQCGSSAASHRNFVHQGTWTTPPICLVPLRSPSG